MREPKGRYKLVGYSLKEIRRAFEDELLRLRDNDVKVLDQTVSRTDLINAVFLWYLGQLPAERDLIIQAAVPELRARLESDDPIPIVIPGDALGPGESARGLGGVTRKVKKGKPKRSDLPILDDN